MAGVQAVPRSGRQEARTTHGSCPDHDRAGILYQKIAMLPVSRYAVAQRSVISSFLKQPRISNVHVQIRRINHKSPRRNTHASSKSHRKWEWTAPLFCAGTGAWGIAGGLLLAKYLQSSAEDSNAQPYGQFPAPKYASLTEMEQALTEIRAATSEETISTDDEDLRTHGFSEWAPANIDTLPIAVAYPKSTEEVSKIATICHKYRIPMTGYSGGSSLEGNFAVPHGGISVDFAFMDRVLEFHEEDMVSQLLGVPLLIFPLPINRSGVAVVWSRTKLTVAYHSAILETHEWNMLT